MVIPRVAIHRGRMPCDGLFSSPSGLRPPSVVKDFDKFWPGTIQICPFSTPISTIPSPSFKK